MPQGKFSGGCQAKDAPAYDDHIKGNCLIPRFGSVVREGGHCIVLYCIVLYYIVLYCTVLYCTVLYCTILYCINRLPLQDWADINGDLRHNTEKATSDYR